MQTRKTAMNQPEVSATTTGNGSYNSIFGLELEDAINKLNMSEVSVRDIFKVSMDIEKRREKLYYILADMTEEESIKALFVFLAEEQKKHFKAFQKRLDEIGKLLDLVDRMRHTNRNNNYTVERFFDLKILEGKLKNLSDIDSVYDFAISNVLDQILFYQQIKSSVADSQQFFVDEIIDEEHRHFLRLVQMKKAKGH